MPVEINDVDGGLGNLIRSWGIVKEQELLYSLKRHLSQDQVKFSKYKFSLTDYMEVENIIFSVPSTPIVSTVAEYCKKSSIVNSDAVVAIAANQDLLFGISRMWETLSYETGWEIMIFRNMEEAKIWIRKRVKEKFKIGDLNFC